MQVVKLNTVMQEETHMVYKFLEHMTDAYIEAEGNTLEEAFAEAARALVDTMIDITSIEERESVKITTSGKDLKELLYNWLEEVMLKLLVERLALSKFKVSINSNHIVAEAWGESLDLEKHKYKVEIKGVTYHMMEIESNSIFKVRFVLDL